MKKIFTLITILAVTLGLAAQTPEQISYQAVVRDAGNNLLTNQTIGVQVSILQGSSNGSAVYIETHLPQSNDNGLVTFQIGTGTAVSGDFSLIDWSVGPYFVKTEIDPAGGTSYSIISTSQLLSVPYALHAKIAESLSGGVEEVDPVFIGSEAANITATDISNLGNLSGTNTGDQDMSGIANNTQAIKDSAANIRSDLAIVATTGDYEDLLNAPELSDTASYLKTESQSLAEVAAIGNAVNTQLKNVTDPTDAQDAATKAYVDLLEQKVYELELQSDLNSGLGAGELQDSGRTEQELIDAGYIGTVTDVDGNIYKWVKIGGQIWMAENLRTSSYNNGDVIPNVTDDTQWSNLSTGAFCWYNNDSATYEAVYGKLYNKFVVKDTRNVCPDGWHVPTNQDFQFLVDYLNRSGHYKNTGIVLGSESGWYNDQNGTDNYDFKAEPGGVRINVGAFADMTYLATFSTASNSGSISTHSKEIRVNNTLTFQNQSRNNNAGLSIRCLKY